MRCLPIAVAGAMLAPALASAQVTPDSRGEFSARSALRSHLPSVQGVLAVSPCRPDDERHPEVMTSR